MSNKITINVKRKPQRTGDIYLIRCKGEPIYVGKTINMTIRWHKHQYSTTQPMRKHMAEFGLQLDDYNYEILETMKVVDQYDKKLCAAEATHFHCFIEQGYKLINELTPNNGGNNDRNSISYANHQAKNAVKIPCEFCGKIAARGHLRRHQRSEECKYLQMYQFTQNLTL